MYNKIYENKIRDSFIKIYDADFEYNILDLINLLQESKNNIKNIYIKEDADIGLKTFEGSYLLDDFVEKYNNINADNISSIVINLESKIILQVYMDKKISMIADADDVDLNDLISVNSRSIVK